MNDVSNKRLWRFALISLALAGIWESGSAHNGVNHAAEDELLAAAVAVANAVNVDTAAANAQAANVVIAAAERDDVGTWGSIIRWPHIPVSIANLPNGNILSWSSSEINAFPTGNPEFTHAAVWNPQTNAFTNVSHSGHDMFCGHNVMLEDGRVFVNGGRNSVRFTSVFDISTNRWQKLPDLMNNGRWYPSSIALADGGVFTAVGSQGGRFPEVWRPGRGWDRLTNIDLSSPIINYSANAFYEHIWWPLLTTTPDGELLHYGPTPRMHRIRTDGEGSIRDVGPAVTDWYPKHGASAYYAPGKILHAGGSRSGRDLSSSNKSFVVDFTNGASRISPAAPMIKSRKYQNAVPLPNGEVIIVGGNTSGTKFSDNGAVYPAEIWNPALNQWRLTAPMSVPRTYHSVALLLPDGTVLSGGGGLCGGCIVNHLNAQIFYPPYLYDEHGNFAQRPEITSSPESVRNGDSFTVTATPGAARFSFIKMSSTTHGVNTDQRQIASSFAEVSAGVYQLHADANVNVLTPGYYMLFALNTAGTPSHAATVQVIANENPTQYAPKLELERVENLIVGKDYVIRASVIDPDDDRHVFNASGLPPGLQIASDTGQIRGRPTTTGNFTVRVTVTDPSNLSDTKIVTWHVGDATGIEYSYYEGSWNVVPNFLAMTPVATGVVNAFKLDFSNRRSDYFGVRFQGKLRATVEGLYTFYTQSDDGSMLYIDGELVVNNDGLHSLSERSGQRYLGIGYHDIVVSFFEKTGGEVLNVLYQGPGIPKAPIPPSALYIEEPVVNEDPVISEPDDRRHLVNTRFSLSLTASDADGDALRFVATGLPPGLNLASNARRISGTPTTVGIYDVVVEVSDGNGGFASTTFEIEIIPESAGPLAINAIFAAPVRVNTNANFRATVTGGRQPRISWNFGDGSSPTEPSDVFSISHRFRDPGRYRVEVTAQSDDGQVEQHAFIQSVHLPTDTARAATSMSLVYESRSGTQDRLWVVNPDNASVSVFNVVTDDRIREISVGNNPRSVAQAPGGRIWVSNRLDATISIINADTLAVERVARLPYGSQPHGIVFGPAGRHAWVVGAGNGELMRLDPTTAALTRRISIGGNLRHVSVSATGEHVFVSKYISPPLPDESTSIPRVQDGNRFYGGEAAVVSTSDFSVRRIDLRVSTRPDAENGGRGIPNYLGPVVVSPDGSQAYIPSKQDNIQRGRLRDGQPLDHDNTVRSISSRIDLATLAEDYDARIDHDDGGVASTAIFGPWGTYLYVALEGSRQVAMLDAHSGVQIRRIEVGRAPQGLTLSPLGRYLFVHNFMDRSVSKLDLNELLYTIGNDLPRTTYSSVQSETLADAVFRGKQLFYDAADGRLASERYISCASCHNDGGHDGRVWDLTNLGEGLRNTIDLRGHGGLDHGVLHWSGNFDEVQDFEGQIRNLASGTGLMSDNDFHSGTRSNPIGDLKTGISIALDRLASYVSSLKRYPPSAARAADGSMSSAARQGRQAFIAKGCNSCHGGAHMTDSRLNNRHDIGTIDSASGDRLGGLLDGLDTPGLRGIRASAPYLHDGSAATVEAAIARHQGHSTSETERQLIASYLNQLEGPARDDSETTPSCGRPAIDSARETALFVWNDCGNKDWHVLASAGDANGSTRSFSGRIDVSPTYSNLTGVSLESSDSLTAISDSRINFAIKTSAPWRDEFRFRQGSNGTICIEASQSAGPVLIGSTRIAAPGSGAFNPETLESCQIDRDDRPTIPCGRPPIDSSSDRGFFVWADCASNRWHLLASGSTASDVSDNYAGRVTASRGSVTVTHLSIEQSDRVTANGGRAEFNVRTVRPWSDEFTVRAIDDADICVEITTTPNDVPILVGPERRPASTRRFDPNTLNACN